MVLLRPWRAADVPAKLLAFSDPLVQRFSWPATAPCTEADAYRFFAAQEQARLRGEELNFALAIRRGSGRAGGEPGMVVREPPAETQAR